MRVERYDSSKARLWDEFVIASKNGTFLFLRDYMDYHRARFEDHSLLIWEDGGTVVAILPANRTDNILVSHGGLTYGGLVTDGGMKLPKMLEVFEAILAFLRENSFNEFIYKIIPHIYHRAPAEEDLYALFLANAVLRRRGVLTVSDSGHRLPVQERRRRGAKKAQQNRLEVRQSSDFEGYWKILSERLWQAYGTLPVHNLAEIELLRAKFPENIKLFSAFQDETMMAGVVIYETEQVAHVQYIAANERSRELGALDLIFCELLGNYYQSTPYFDFGTSDEGNGRTLNRGLIDQKEGYGARVVTQDQYVLDLAAWVPGQLVGALR